MAKWTAMREAWSSARDKAGLKKGAVSGVSLGDAIDKVVRGQAKGYQNLSKACTELETALGKYKSKVGKTHADLQKWIDKEIGEELKVLQGGLSADLTSMKWIVKSCIDEVSGTEYSVMPDSAHLKRAVEMMQPPNKKSWDEAIVSARVFDVTRNVVPVLAKRGMYLKNISWHARLVGHDAHYKTLIEYADFLIDTAKFCAAWSKATSPTEYANFSMELRSRPLNDQMNADLRTAVAALMT